MNSIQPQVTSLEINSKKDNSHKEPNNSAYTPIIMPISINNYDSFNNQNNEQKKPKQINQQISKIKFEIINEPLNTNSENRLLNENEVSNKELNNNSKKIKKNKNKFKICHFEYKKTQKDENDEIISNRLKHKRKYKPDDIRKKIKARFHKSIKNIINENLRKAGSKKLISRMKYCDLLEEYFKSNEFERAIFKLKEENEDEEYIKEYIIKSKNYLKFFMENDKLKIKEEEKKNLEEEEKKKIQNE